MTVTDPRSSKSWWQWALANTSRLALGALLLAPALAAAAAFTCPKGLDRLEGLICADRFVSHIDDRLTLQYQRDLDLASEAERPSMRAEQARFLAATRRECSDVGCVRDAYLRRLAQLSPPAPSEAAQQEALARAHSCPYCGLWAIYDASITTATHAKLRELDSAEGRYAFVDEAWAYLPDCYQGHYSNVTVSVQQIGTAEREAMPLIKTTIRLESSALTRECVQLDPQITFSVSSASDELGQAALVGHLADGSSNNIELAAYEVSRASPDQLGTVSRVGFDRFSQKAAEARLAFLSARLRPWYQRDHRAPFDAAEFSGRVKEFCAQYSSKETDNASIAERMGQCSIGLLQKKIDALVQALDCGDEPASHLCRALPKDGL